ncbi:phosphoadenylyl-sulfate reductase [Gracilimonas tropica]|uniref:phosphoadenylyl-sulfate reductase n=1 Tax=Gracilimonas tropica TaxID=454600 RepID=UPI00035F8340|nr:phosphoadenylyl-sulfate reductase [Gracilimonas tropica]
MESVQIKKINQSLSAAHNDVRIAHILNKYLDEVLITTSFGTTSALLIHMISRIRPDHPIHFINTGYLFPETLQYKDQLIERYGVNIIDHIPDEEKHRITKQDELWKSNPDLCCHYNKVEPLEKLKADHKVWISGLIGYQNSYRSGLEILQQKDDIYRYYPLIDWTPEMVDDYFESLGIPRHPLERFGFDSIGCTHCTQKGEGRDGRWSGSGKTECGLHL